MIKKTMFLFTALIVISTAQAKADQAQDEQSIKVLNNTFADAFVHKDAALRASVYARDGTLLTPQGIFLVGRAAMLKDFGPEAQAFVTKDTTEDFSDYHFRFIGPDLAFVDSVITVHNINGPDGKVIGVAHISVTQTAIRQAGKWLIEDERAHFLPPPFHPADVPQ